MLRSRFRQVRSGHRSQIEALEARQLLSIAPADPSITTGKVDQFATALFGADWQAASGLSPVEIQRRIASGTWQGLLVDADNSFLTEFRSSVQTSLGAACTNAYVRGMLQEANLPVPASSVTALPYYDWITAADEMPAVPIASQQSDIGTKEALDGAAHDGGEGGYLSVSNPIVEINPGSTTTSLTNPATAQFEVTWHARAGDEFMVNFRTQDGSASHLTDYDQTTGKIHFANGAEGGHATIEVPIYGGDQKNFSLELFNIVPAGGPNGGEGTPSNLPSGTASMVDHDASNPIDLSITSFDVDASTQNLKVNYHADVDHAGAQSQFEARLVAIDSAGGEHTMMSKQVTTPLTTNDYSFSFSGWLNDPDSPYTHDILGDYRLEVRLDPANALNEAPGDQPDNVAAFHGIFMDALGVVVVQGTQDYDRVDSTIATVGGISSLKVQMKSAHNILDSPYKTWSQEFPLTSVKSLHVRTDNKNDIVETDGDLSEIVWLFGGAGDDSLTGGFGTNYIDGGAGSDTIEITGGATDAGAVTNGFDHLLRGGDDQEEDVNVFRVIQAASNPNVYVSITGGGNDYVDVFAAGASGADINYSSSGLTVNSTMVIASGVAEYTATGTSGADSFVVDMPDLETYLPALVVNGTATDSLTVNDFENADQEVTVTSEVIGSRNASVWYSGVAIIEINGLATSQTNSLQLIGDAIQYSDSELSIADGPNVNSSGFAQTIFDAASVQVTAPITSNLVELDNDAVRVGDGTEFILTGRVSSLDLATYSTSTMMTVTAPATTLEFVGIYFFGASAGWLTVNGSAGDDVITVSDGEVYVNGVSLIYVALSSVTVYGGAGDDVITLNGSPISADVYAGPGDNTIAFMGLPTGLFTIHQAGEDASDTLDFSQFSNGLVLNLNSSAFQLHGAMILWLIGTPSIQTVIGTENADTITANSLGDHIEGLGGSDILTGGAGNDFLNGGDSQDQLFGGEGDDEIWGGDDDDWLDGGDDVDLLFGDEGNDTLIGAAGGDTLDGGGGDDELDGGEGDDDLDGGDGENSIEDEDAPSEILPPSLLPVSTLLTTDIAGQNTLGDILVSMGIKYTIYARVQKPPDTPGGLTLYGRRGGEGWFGGGSSTSHGGTGGDATASTGDATTSTDPYGTAFAQAQSFAFWYNQPLNSYAQVTPSVKEAIVRNTGKIDVTVNSTTVAPGASYTFNNLAYAGYGTGDQSAFTDGTTIDVGVGDSNIPIDFQVTAVNHHPGSSLSFELIDAPSGAMITSTSATAAQIHWVVNSHDPSATHKFTVKVIDSTDESLFATENYYVLVSNQENPDDVIWTPVARDEDFLSQDSEDITGVVLANDYDTDQSPSPIHIASYSQPSHAHAFSMNSNGHFIYTPDDDYVGMDSFTYTVTDGEGNSNVALVSFMLQPRPTLHIRKMNDDKDGGFNEVPTGDGDWLEASQLTGTPTSGKGIYLPVDNDDDDYDGSADNKITRGQSAIPPRVDNDLLEIVVTRAMMDNPVMKFEIPTSVLRIWKVSDGAYQRVDGQEFGFAVGQTSMKFYLQGVGSREGSGTLKLLYKDATTNKFTPVENGAVTVHTFVIAGPRYVPDYSKQNYSAKGGAGGNLSEFVEPKRGTEKANTPSTVGSDTTQVLWTDGATFGKLRYQASPNYTWAFDVAIVEVVLDLSPTVSEFKVETNPANKPVQSTLQPKRIDSTTGRSGPGERNVRYGTSLPTGRRFLDEPAMKMNVTISRIEGPTAIIDGDVKMYGVKHIDVGIVQSMTFTQYSRITAGGVVPFNINGEVLLDAVNSDGTPNSTYSNPIRVPVRPQLPYYGKAIGAGYFKSDEDDLVENEVIGITDTPANNGTNLSGVQGYNMVFDFTDYVVVRTTDRINNADKNYAIRARGAWRFDGSGTFAASGAYTFTGTGLSVTEVLAGKDAGESLPESLLTSEIANKLLP